MFKFYRKDVTHAFKIGYLQFMAYLKGTFIPLCIIFACGIMLGVLYLWYTQRQIPVYLSGITPLTRAEGITLAGAIGLLGLLCVFMLGIVGLLGYGLFKLLVHLGMAGYYFLYMLFYPLYITQYSLAKWEEDVTNEWEFLKKRKDIS